MNWLRISLVAFSIASTSTIAEARRQDREGFNFGLGIRAMGNNDSTSGKNNNDDLRKTVHSQAVSPFVGYVFFDTLNLGFSGYIEEEATQENFSSKDGSHEINRRTKSSLKGGGLYARFNFAKYLYFSAGAGIYDRRVKITDEYKERSANGEFTGEENRTTAKAIGPGYDVGFGVEVPVAQGFFISSSYVVRSFSLRDNEGNDGIGKKRTSIEKRELSFGLTHYVK